MIKYLGSKRALVPELLAQVGACDGVRHVLDAFSGTARVGHALKHAGYRVTANDHNRYAATLARCYVAADRDVVIDRVTATIAALEQAPAHDGWFTELYGRQARYFHPDNAAKIEGMRRRIDELELPDDVRAVALVALMEAADRVDSTTGVQMAYLKQWAARALRPIALRIPAVLPGPGAALELDALAAVAAVRDVDLVYLDPPYNQHSYLGNYHVWETLVRYDAPDTYGVARKRIDCRARQSAFNSKLKFAPQLRALIAAITARYVLVSFSDEGFVAREQLIEWLSAQGKLTITTVSYPRYVGAKIGIHDPQGRKVGKVGRLRNLEQVFALDRQGRPGDILERVAAPIESR